MRNILLARGTATAIAALLTLTLVGCTGDEQSESDASSSGSTDFGKTGGTAPTQGSTLQFATSEFGPAAFPADRGEYWENPYWFEADVVDEVIPLTNDIEGKMVDANGALVVNWPGYDEPIYHPVHTAMYGLYAFMAYEHTGEAVYLQRAEANAQAIVDGAEEVDGALWFPYSIRHTMHGDESMVLEPPWYSGMAQGQTLELLSKLCGATETSYWCEQADKTFESYLQTDLPEQSFVWVDDEGHLWLEEYVGSVPPTEVINGHIYSAFGLAEYAQQTGNETAEQMFNGAATTILDTYDDFRVPGGISYYCAAQYCKDTSWQPENYHRGVARQFLILNHLTDIPQFEEMKKEFMSDYTQWKSGQEE